MDEDFGLAAELADSIGQGQIEAWFQPQMDLHTGCMVGVESLARWRHPQRGLLEPSRFLPVLALTDAYNAFTDEMLRQALAFAAYTEAAGAPLDVSVNCGVATFLDCRTAGSIETMLAAFGVRPERLKVELIESEMIADKVDPRPAFEALAAVGIRLSIDDFGVGFSSLGRLSVLPVHELKIDLSFVATMFSNPSMQMIVRAIVDLANGLGLNSVAEGIECESAARLLRELGCRHGQGFLFERPLPADVFRERFTVVDGRWLPAAEAGRSARN